MWGTIWSFGDSLDNYWLEEKGGIALMSQCGFRIFRSEEFGYFFGIDGAGYDFYEAHWIPLIRENVDALVKEYSEEYQVWEYKALKYANDHKHGISALIIKDIYYDKIWTKDFSSSR